MKRGVTALLVVFLCDGAAFAQQNIAVEQQNLMKAQGKSVYGVLGRMAKGQSPYDQATIDAALTQLETDVGKIAGVFAANPKEDVANADYGSSQKIWQNKVDFDSKVPPVVKAIADAKGKIKDVESLKVAFDAIDARCTGCHETYRVKLK